MPNKEKNIVVQHDVSNVDLATLKRYYDSLGEACKLLLGRIEVLEKENKLALSLKEQADKNVEQQKQIVINNLMQSRERETQLSTEIIGLKKKLKLLNN